MSNDERRAHIIRDDREAIAAAHQVAAEIAKGAAERDRERRLPAEEIELYSQSGLWAITVPREYGGAGVSYVTVAEVFRIISAADGSIGQMAQNHIYGAEAIRLDGTEEQKRFFFDLLLRGGRLGNGFSESGTKHMGEIKTRVTRSGSGYVVNGKKFYCTGATFAHWLMIGALDDEDRLVLAFVERNAPGLTIMDDWSAFGQRTTASGTMIIEDVAARADLLLPHHQTLARVTPMGPIAQIMHVAIDVGIAGGALKAAVEFVRTQARPGPESGVEHAYQDPLVIYQFGEMQVRLSASEALLRRAAELLDRAVAEMTEENVAEASLAVAMAKAMGTETAMFITTKLFELCGTKSTMDRFNLDRYWRDARTHTLHDPVRRKYFVIGEHCLNGVKPARLPWL